MKKFKKHSGILPGASIILYFFFYLFSPFLHSHHDLNDHHNSNYYHTHLVDNNSNKDCNSDNISLQNDEHEHQISLSSFLTITTPRFQYSHSSIVLFNIPVNIELIDGKTNQKFFNQQLKTKLLQDKYVHSSGNVSPPVKYTA